MLLDFLEIAKKSTVDGETCLHLTAISNDFDIAELMIDLGADVNARVTHPEVRISEMPFVTAFHGRKTRDLQLTFATMLNRVCA